MKSLLHLNLWELSPTVELVTHHHFRRDIWFHYRIPSNHLILVESGCIEAKTPYGWFKAYAGDLICFRSTDWNQYGTHGETLYYDTHVEFAPPPRHRLTPFLDGVGPLPICLPLGEGANEARRLFETLCLEVRSPGVFAVLKTRAAIFELLALVARVMGPHREATQLLDSWQRVEQRMMGSLNTELKVARVADELGLSAEHFIRQFKRRFGLSPKAYHTQARMREAVRLLRDNEKSVKAVAYSLGFSNPKSFTRSFKQHLGVSPSDLRRAPVKGIMPASSKPARLIPLNQHMMPPNTRADWFKQFLPKGSGQILKKEQDDILEKISHPENLPQANLG